MNQNSEKQQYVFLKKGMENFICQKNCSRINEVLGGLNKDLFDKTESQKKVCNILNISLGNLGKKLKFQIFQNKFGKDFLGLVVEKDGIDSLKDLDRIIKGYSF